MATFAFTAIVNGLDVEDVAQIDALYTDRFETLPGSIDNVTSLDVVIDAETDGEALDTVLDHLATLPWLTVTRIDDDLVHLPEIADRLDVTREAARLWSNGKRATDFPAHRTVVGQQKVWAWADVYTWALQHGRLPDDEPTPLAAHRVAWINGQLALANQDQTCETTSGWKTISLRPRAVPTPAPSDEWNGPRTTLKGAS